MLNTKKRRRKKKKTTETLLNVRKKTHIQPTTVSKLPKSKPKLNANYKTEELEVQSALLSRQKTDPDFDAKDIDRQISFFVNNVVVTQPEDIVPNNGSEQSLKTNDNGLQLASSFVLIEDETPVEKCKKEKILYDDDQLLYYPDGRSRLNRTEEYHSPRDDGLFEPIKPSRKNGMALLVNRFTEENSNDWVTETNQLPGLQNFVQSTRLVRSVADKEFPTIPYSSRPHSVEDNHRHSDLNREKILKIHIHDVTFHSHPCLNKEQILARNIENRYKQYVLRRSMAVVERLQQKLNALRKLQMLATDNNVDNKRTYRNDIRDLRTQLHREQRIDRDILTSILEQWKSLKKLRTEQGFVTTSIKLIIRTDAVDESIDREVYRRDFELELNEIFDESMQDYLADRKQRKSDTDNRGDDFELIKKMVKPDIEVIREELLTEYRKCMRPPGEPIIRVELQTTEDSVDTRKIRDHFSNSKFLLQIAFDRTKLNSERNVQSVAGDRIILDAIYSVKFRNAVPTNIQLSVSSDLPVD